MVIVRWGFHPGCRFVKRRTGLMLVLLLMIMMEMDMMVVVMTEVEFILEIFLN